MLYERLGVRRGPTDEFRIERAGTDNAQLNARDLEITLRR